MPFIAFELDALNAAPDLARSAGIPESDAIAGLVRMWAYCWRTKTDAVDRHRLVGFFGAEDHDRLANALQSFGFIDVAGNSFRIRGAERYLRIRSGNSAGGKAAKSNLKQYRVASGSKPAGAGNQAGVEPVTKPESKTGSTSSIEHRASKKEETTKAPLFAAHQPTEPNRPEQRDASKTETERPSTDARMVQWWAKACSKRTELTAALPERPPGLEAFWKRALSELNGDPSPLGAAWERYLEDPWAKTLKPAPFSFAGFVGKDGNRWRQFVRTREVDDSDGFREFKPGDDLYAPRGA